ncbi:hypothetical protein HDZ31DRAFT_35321 [Schizophyllum fasciatum]
MSTTPAAEPSSSSGTGTVSDTETPSSPPPRSWQTQRPPASHHVLGWIITDEICHTFCRRQCALPKYHTQPGSMADSVHLDILRQLIGALICDAYNLPCAGPVLVYDSAGDSAPGVRREMCWAVVLADNWGWSALQRRLPHPAVVDAIKEDMETAAEPRWLVRAT